MLLLIDLLRALRGLARLFRFDESYRNHFDPSIQGTWRSFFAMMLVAPAIALALPENLNAIYPKATSFEFYIVMLLTYVISWMGSPLIALEIGRRLNRLDDMPAYITVYNWYQLMALPFALAAWAAGEAGLPGFSDLLDLVSIAVYFIFLFYLAKTFLRLQSYQAALFVIADLGFFLLLIVTRDIVLLY